MKKHKLLITLAVFLLIAIGGVGYAYARTSQIREDMVVQMEEAEDNVMVGIEILDQTEATTTDMIDISDNTNFPHITTTGDIEISQIRTVFSAEGLASTTVKYGVIASTSPDGSVVDVQYFHTVVYDSLDSAVKTDVFDASPSLIKFAISSASTTDIVSNDFVRSTTTMATTSPITSPLGEFTVAPGVGDLIMTVYDIVGTVDIRSQVMYHDNW